MTAFRSREEFEEQVERWAEKEMDRMDRMLMSGSISQEDYDRMVADLDKEVRDEYREAGY